VSSCEPGKADRGVPLVMAHPTKPGVLTRYDRLPSPNSGCAGVGGFSPRHTLQRTAVVSGVPRSDGRLIFRGTAITDDGGRKVAVCNPGVVSAGHPEIGEP
jgi:hypothetical protein